MTIEAEDIRASRVFARDGGDGMKLRALHLRRRRHARRHRGGAPPGVQRRLPARTVASPGSGAASCTASCCGVTGGKERIGAYLESLPLRGAETERLRRLVPLVHAPRRSASPSCRRDGQRPAAAGRRAADRRGAGGRAAARDRVDDDPGQRRTRCSRATLGLGALALVRRDRVRRRRREARSRRRTSTGSRSEPCACRRKAASPSRTRRSACARRKRGGALHDRGRRPAGPRRRISRAADLACRRSAIRSVRSTRPPPRGSAARPCSGSRSSSSFLAGRLNDAHRSHDAHAVPDRGAPPPSRARPAS